jgi:hypothetical protein
MVSAINGVHNLLGLVVPVVTDAQHRLFMSGLGRILVPAAPAVERQCNDTPKGDASMPRFRPIDPVTLQAACLGWYLQIGQQCSGVCTSMAGNPSGMWGCRGRAVPEPALPL